MQRSDYRLQGLRSRREETTLRSCDNGQILAFEKHAVEPFLAPLERYGKMTMVVVVARKGDEVIYYEDMDEGFNVSAISTEDVIVQRRCNQDNLGLALNRWIEGRVSGVELLPTISSRPWLLQERLESINLERSWIKETTSQQTY